jgi:lysine-N-methylase
MPRAELEVELAAPAHLRPHYADDFRCLASACTENCCNGWTIPVDRATYESYREHPVLKPFAQSLIVLNPRSRSTGDFASMPLSHQGTCAFLDPQSLCGIHKHFGAPMLSAACASYPREPAEIAGAHEASLSLSCPEAARLTLLNPSLLSDIPAPLTKELPPDFQPTLALRDLSLKLLADRTFPLWQRLHRLGELARRLESLSHPKPAREWAQSHPTTVAHFIAEFTATAPPLSQHEDSTTLQLEFITEVLRTRLAEGPPPPPPPPHPPPGSPTHPSHPVSSKPLKPSPLASHGASPSPSSLPRPPADTRKPAPSSSTRSSKPTRTCSKTSSPTTCSNISYR